MLNPFSLPDNDPDIYHQRQIQRIKQHQNKVRLMQLSVATRYKQLQNPSILKELQSSSNASSSLLALPPIQQNKQFGSKKETIRQFIQRKRQILLVKKSIRNKKQRTKFLDLNIKAAEDEVKANQKALDDNYGRVKKYEQKLKHDADNKALEAEARVTQRMNKQKHLNQLIEDIDYKIAQKQRKEDELKKLKKYKDFVKILTPPEFYQSSQAEPSPYITQAPPPRIFFRTTNQFLQQINFSELENLHLIEKSQEDQQDLQKQRYDNSIFETELEQEQTLLNVDKKAAQSKKKQLLQKLKDLKNVNADEYSSDQGLMKLIRSKLEVLYADIGGDTSNNPSSLDMLEFIENSLQFLLVIRSKMDEKTLRRVEREIDRDRRVEYAQEKKLQDNQKALEKNKKYEERRNRPIKKRGRPNMERSALKEKVKAKPPPKIPQEVKDWKEFLEEDIPY